MDKNFMDIAFIEKEQGRITRMLYLLEYCSMDYRYLIDSVDENYETDISYFFTHDSVIIVNFIEDTFDMVSIDEAQNMIDGIENVISLDRKKSEDEKKVYETSLEIAKHKLHEYVIVLEKEHILASAFLGRTLR